MSPKECLVTASSGSKTEAAKLHQVISRSGVLLTERKKGSLSLAAAHRTHSLLSAVHGDVVDSSALFQVDQSMIQLFVCLFVCLFD